MTTFRVGQFVKSMENNLGIGKVQSTEGDWVTVEYFDSPTTDEHPTRTLPASAVNPTELHQETRVYFKNPVDQTWFVGRALIKTNNEYRVQFPNRKVGELPESALYVRWDRPIEDPTDHLAQRVNETPYFHDGRAPFRASLVEQRAACAGMTGLFSSVIELEEHQIEVVRRVLEDPVQRYLLADEVGLGKTIEAGAIMRQYALDRPRDFGILVVVPRHLCEQWEEELAQRFLFDQELGERVHVVPHDATHEVLDKGMEVGMVVVDEVHQVAQHAHSEDDYQRGIYDSIKTACDIANKVLILSGTPVLHNEAGYLAMLHLLDPLRYPLNDVDGFRERIRNRQDVAELFHKFHVDEDDEEIEGLSEELVEFFPDDARLDDLVDELQQELGADDSEERDGLVEAIRTHISETYRLHRRILRTRHSEQTEWLLPGRAEIDVQEFEDDHREEIEGLVEKWRQQAAAFVDAADSEDAAGYVALYREFFDATCGLPQALVRKVEERQEIIGDDDFNGPATFDGEDEILRNLATKARDAADAGRRLDALVDHLGELKQKQKAVVFVTDQQEANAVYQRLDDDLDITVVRHEVVRHHHEAQWKEFLSDESCQVLVCDGYAEEGLNLQGSQAQLVHLDVPTSPNRIEQRIGRLDRYGTGQAVESAIFQAPQSSYLSKLIELHRDGFGVFERSISALQYLVDDKLSALWPQIFFDGLDAIDDAIDRLGGDEGQVATELERVRAQDELDALEESQKSDDEFYDRLWDVDFDAERLDDVAYNWIRNRLQFHKVETAHDHERIFRYEYRTDATAKHPTLLPIRELLGRFAVAVDPDKGGFFSYPMSFHRGAACSNMVRVARIGEPFMTSMKDYIRWDDRGTSFAMWRHVPRAQIEDDPGVYFRFDFLIEADISKAVQALAGHEHVTEEALRLRADGLFPPLMKTVWVRGDSKPVTDDEAEELLEMSYDQEGTKRFGRDYNLNTDRWEVVEKFFPREKWTSTCHDVRQAAEDILADEVGLTERCERYAKRANQKGRQNLNRLKTRAARADDLTKSSEVESMELEEKLLSAIEEGIHSPQIGLDAIGAIFLSTANPFADEVDER